MVRLLLPLDQISREGISIYYSAFSESWTHVLQKIHVQSRSNARKLNFSKRGRRLPLIRRRVCCDQKLISSQIGGRRCPQCCSSMRLAWIEPDEKPGYDRRTFECLHCDHLDTVMVKYRPAR